MKTVENGASVFKVKNGDFTVKFAITYCISKDPS